VLGKTWTWLDENWMETAFRAAVKHLGSAYERVYIASHMWKQFEKQIWAWRVIQNLQRGGGGTQDQETYFASIVRYLHMAVAVH